MAFRAVQALAARRGQRRSSVRLRPSRKSRHARAMMRRSAAAGTLFVIAWWLHPARAAAGADGPAPLGITYAGWKGDYRAANKRLETFKAIGFQIVSFVPTYAYVNLDKIDLAAGPDAAELGAAV